MTKRNANIHSSKDRTKYVAEGINLYSPSKAALRLFGDRNSSGEPPNYSAEHMNAYRRELLVHCYRMVGSLSDAEDLVQETLLRAWEKRATLTSPESYRAWLYRIATNLCLNRLTRAPRRSLPTETHPESDPRSPAPPRL